MRKIILMVLLIIIVSTLIVVGVVVLSPKDSNNTTNVYADLIKTEPEIYLPYDTGTPFIANIKDSKRFVKASVVIEVMTPEELRILEDLNYKTRDAIIKILRNKDESEYLDTSIQEVLKNEIKNELITTLQMKSIKSVYFKEFIIQ